VVIQEVDLVLHLVRDTRGKLHLVKVILVNLDRVILVKPLLVRVILVKVNLVRDTLVKPLRAKATLDKLNGLRGTVELLLLAKVTKVPHLLVKVAIQAVLQTHRSLSGSMQLTRIGLDKLTARNCKKLWSMATGPISVKRLAG